MDLPKHLRAGTEQIAPGQPRPNFFVAGVSKAGTTSLYEYLKQHPDVFVTETKEPCYFVEGFGLKKWDDYLALFQNAGHKKAVGECSTLYSYCEESPGWIKSVLGDMKIILLLRNPAQRAFSLYCWNVREGYENAPTFAEALRREPERMSNPDFRERAPFYYRNYFYFHCGLYFEQVSRCIRIFGRNHVQIHLFEEFVREPVAVSQQVFRFLGVDDTYFPTIGQHNEGRLPWSVAGQAWLRAETKRKRLIGSRSLRSKIAVGLMNWNAGFGCKPKADRGDLAKLAERYRADIEKLQALIDRDLSSWL